MTCARFRSTGLVLGAALLELMAIFDVRKTYGIKPGNLGNIVTKGGGGNLALWLIFFNTLILSTILVIPLIQSLRRQEVPSERLIKEEKRFHTTDELKEILEEIDI
jgi:hypothetical protein